MVANPPRRPEFAHWSRMALLSVSFHTAAVAFFFFNTPPPPEKKKKKKKPGWQRYRFIFQLRDDRKKKKKPTPLASLCKFRG